MALPPSEVLLKLLFLDFSTKLETIHDLKNRARGGMVSSLFRVPDELSKRGHEVYVLSDIKEPGQTRAGVKWIIDNPPSVDALVTNRGTGGGYPEIRARHRVLWTHDLPHHGFALDPRILRAFSRVVFMSRYGEGVWRTFYRTIGKGVVIPNGVDREMFQPLEKDLRSLIYISAPNRGLERLPEIFGAIRERIPSVRMKAYSNLAKLHPNEGRDTYWQAYRECDEAGIEMVDPVPQPELARELGRAGLMILPTGYPEICSNAVLQALSCGVPIVTTGGLGATPEWVDGHNGMLTRYMPHDYVVYLVEMVRGAVAILENERLHKQLIHNAPKTKGLFTWEQIADKWHKMLTALG
jgi:glycosyltransferase involved in cell wall biosynthesis